MLNIRILLSLILVASATSAFASFHTAKEGSKVFIIESKEKPAKVLPAQKASESQGIMMRMPNLDESTVEGAPHKQNTRNLSNPHVDSSKNSKSKTTASKKSKVTTLKFSKSKINGELRLPRVKFSKVRPAVDIREEMPDVDFNRKTLTESGF